MKFALLIQPPTAGSTLAGDAELDYALDTEIAQGARVQGVACFGIPATDPGSLPTFYNRATGEACETFPHVYTHDGLVCGVTVTGPIDHTTDFVVDGKPWGRDVWTADVPDVPLANPFTAWGLSLAGLAVRIHTPASVTFTATLSGTPIEVDKAGTSMREEVHFARFLGNGGQLGPGLTVYARFRGDFEAAEIRLEIHNNLYHPQASTLFATDPDVVGELWFDSIDFLTLPAQIVAAEEDRPCQDTAASQIVRDEGAPQILPSGQVIAEDYVLYNAGTVTAAQARAIGRMTGIAGAIGGALGVHAFEWWGGAAAHLPRYDDPERAFLGKVGREAFIAYEKSCADPVIAARLSGGTAGGGMQFGQNAVGWWHPYGTIAPGGGSGEEIFFASNGSFTREGFRLHRISAAHLRQRHPSHVVDPNTGHEVLLEDLVAAEGNGRTPYAMGFRTQGPAEISSWFPHFLRPGAAADLTLEPQRAARYIAPEGKAWNAVPSSPLYSNWKQQRCMEFTQQYSAGYIPFEGDHHARYYHAFQALAFGAGYLWAKRNLRQESAHFQRCAQPYRVTTQVGTDFNNPWFRDANSFPNTLEVLTNTGRLEWGNGPANYGITRQRGWAHLGIVVGDALRLTPPSDPFRAITLAWCEAYADDLAAVCTPYGTGERYDQSWNPRDYDTCCPGAASEIYPSAWILWGPTDDPFASWGPCDPAGC